MIIPSSFSVFCIYAITSALSFFTIPNVCAAENGKTLYTTFCSACHAPDGKGANDGAFPPLANSPWLNGNPDRAIQIILHGLQGEIQVPTNKNPKATFNLVMPPQGGTLTDPQIVAILNYVRNNWGNKNKAVTQQDIVANRKATKNRNVMWQADELLKKYPLQHKNGEKAPPIKNLISKVYHGAWKTRPDFSKLKATAVEEEHDGLISLEKAGKSNEYGIVWEGELDVPGTGNYTFKIDSDDGSAVFINGKLVAEVKGIGPMGRAKSGKITLQKGTHDIRVEFFEYQGFENISLSWEGPGLNGKQFLSATQTKNRKKGKKWPSIPIHAPKGGTAFYRGFIAGSTPRAIGVGYDGGVNFAFSADHMGIQLLWQGRFYDGGRHWTNRGQGSEPPPGEKLVKLTSLPSWSVLDSPSSKWNASSPSTAKPRFRGYQLEKKDHPVFNYDIGSLKITDAPEPTSDNSGLIRTITIMAPATGAPSKLHFLVSNTASIKTGDRTNQYRLGDNMLINITSTAIHSPLVRDNELILPLNLKPGKNKLTLHYQWK